MRRKKFLAAILAVVMMITSIQLPPVQVSAEEVNTRAVELKRIDSATLVANAKANSWTVVPDVVNGTGEGPAEWAFDDNMNRFWHSNYNYDANKPENINGTVGNGNNVWIQTGFGKTWWVDSIEYMPRGNSNNVIGQYQISVLNDLNQPSDNPSEDADWKVVKEGVFENKNTSQKIELPYEVPATHIRITALSKIGGGSAHVTAKNISIFGYEEEPIIDKTSLQNVINEADAIVNAEDAGIWSEELLEILETVLVDAKATLDKEDAIYREVVAAEDAIRTAIANLAKKTDIRKYNPNRLTIRTNSEKASPSGGDGPAIWAFDDPTLETWWHSNYPGSENVPSEDNEIWIEAGFEEPWCVSYITYTGRPGRQGVVSTYKIYVANSENPTDEEFYGTEEAPKEPAKSGTLENVNTEQTIELDKSIEATHIRFVVTGTYDGSFCAARDISIYGSDEDPVADKTELEEAISLAESKESNKDFYSVELYTVLEKALETAISLRDNNEATQLAVDEATANLNAAIDNLRGKEELREFNSATLAANVRTNSENVPGQYPRDGYAAWAFDDEEHWWHSDYSSGNNDIPSENTPIWIQTGFDTTWYVDSIDVTGRGQGQINKYEIFVTTANKSKDVLEDGDFTLVKTGTLLNNADKQTIDLGKVVEATHIRIAVKNAYGDSHVSVKKIDIKGYDKLPAIEVSRNELYDVIAEAEALYNEADRLSETDGIDEAHVGTLLAAFNAVKAASDEGKAVVEEATSDVITTHKTTISEAVNALREIYLENSEAKLKGNSLTLNGTIDVNFYMTISEEVRNAEGAYLNFTIDRDGTENDEIWTELLADKNPAEGNNVYLFNVGMPIKDMGTEIKVQIIIPGKEATENTEAIAERKGLVYTYSVEKYIDGIESDESYQGQTELLTLVDTMSNFGDLASVYFNEEEGTPMTDDEKGTLKEALDDYVAVLPEKGVYYGSSLLLRSNTIVRHYFTEQVTNAPDGYTIGNKNGYYYIESAGVPAHELGISKEIIVTTTSGASAITYSPLSYAYSVLCREGDADNLTNLMKAMYDYQQAAVAYKELETE